MTEAYIGEIQMFAGPGMGGQPPYGWAFCYGQLLDINQYAELYSLIGTTYGGDGRTNFALPDLRGRVAIGAGANPKLSPRAVGEKGGAETVTLDLTELPAHAHSLNASTALATSSEAGPTVSFATLPVGDTFYPKPTPADPGTWGALAPGAAGTAGNGSPHENRMPYFAVNFIICTNGIYPQFPN